MATSHGQREQRSGRSKTENRARHGFKSKGQRKSARVKRLAAVSDGKEVAGIVLAKRSRVLMSIAHGGALIFTDVGRFPRVAPISRDVTPDKRKKHEKTSKRQRRTATRARQIITRARAGVGTRETIRACGWGRFSRFALGPVAMPGLSTQETYQ